MKDAPRFIALVLAWSTVVPAAPAGADHACASSLDYRYCGEYVGWDDLPMRFRLNPAGGPVSGAASVRELGAAMAEWNRWWPVATATGGFVGVDLPPDCDGNAHAVALCYDGTTGAGLAIDGINAILWGHPKDCGGSAAALATFCPVYADAGKHRIIEVDIILNKDPPGPIVVPDLLGEVAGEAAVYYGDVFQGYPPQDVCRGPSIAGVRAPLPGRWWDLRSLLAHELGHALGLDHAGVDRHWPSDLTGLTATLQTMYVTLQACSTHARTLADGDVTALSLAAAASRANP